MADTATGYASSDLSRKWKRGSGCWVRDVFVWTKAPLMVRNELIPVDCLCGEHPAHADGLKRLGDEAFGRGSDESTRFALELFDRLGLQLLIVTPLQKIHVIEPYVSAVGFVDNPDSNDSRLQTLTIEEYRARRLAHTISQQIAISDAAPPADDPAGAPVVMPARRPLTCPARGPPRLTCMR